MTPHKFYNVTGEGAGGGQIPNCLSHLKTDKRGYPIPFFVPIIDGIPNFKMADAKKWHYATEQNLCWICGKKLPKAHFFFIGGPMGLQNRISTDCAMHRECAEFTLKTCPHLFYQKAERKISDNAPDYLMPGKPDRIFLIQSSKYKLVPNGQGGKLIKFDVVKTEEFIYENNRLKKIDHEPTIL